MVGLIDVLHTVLHNRRQLVEEPHNRNIVKLENQTLLSSLSRRYATVAGKTLLQVSYLWQRVVSMGS